MCFAEDSRNQSMNRPFKVLGPAVDLFNFMEDANDMIRDDYNRHPLVFAHGVLGFEGYPQEGLFAVPANGDNNFLLYGIVEHSLLIVDQKQPFEMEKLNMFQTDTIIQGKKRLKLSLTRLKGFPYVGRVIMAVSRYD